MEEKMDKKIENEVENLEVLENEEMIEDEPQVIPREYNASSIRVLEGLEAVRKRPAMYIGSTDQHGLNHLALEVIDNSIDEAMGGFCKNIHVILIEPDQISIEDDGRGFPVDIHPGLGISGVEVALTKLHAGGKFDENSYKVSGGLHGVGVSVVNGLSEWLTVEVSRNNNVYRQKFERGIPTTDLEIVGTSEQTGSIVTFKPDKDIFETTIFNENFINNRLKELAFLNQKVRITFENRMTSEIFEYYYEGGINEYLTYLVDGKTTILPEAIYLLKPDENLFVEFSFNYTGSYGETIFSFVNSINTKDGGTHVVGFKSGILRVINEKAILLKYNKDQTKDMFTSEDIRDGLIAIINVRLHDPQFEGQTKGRLGNNFVRKAIEEYVYNEFTYYLDKNPEVAKSVLDRCIVSRDSREAAAKARDLVRRKSFMGSTILPGKLADCSEKDPAKSEVFIVEGDSAGGSAKQGRDRQTQAILPLRGKILNVEKSNLEKIIVNEEIKSLIAALGTGIEQDFNIAKLRYHKVFIMTDADVDGAHIRTLLLTFFYRYLQPLILNGNIYIAQPPLYLIMHDRKEKYVYSDQELASYLKTVTGKYEIQRYKGLGEMSAQQLNDTTMSSKNRVILQVTMENAIEAEHMFTILMGDKVQPRKEFIQKHAKEVTNLDI
jgi:DNA gyrase subunit B